MFQSQGLSLDNLLLESVFSGFIELYLYNILQPQVLVSLIDHRTFIRLLFSSVHV